MAGKDFLQHIKNVEEILQNELVRRGIEAREEEGPSLQSEPETEMAREEQDPASGGDTQQRSAAMDRGLDALNSNKL